MLDQIGIAVFGLLAVILLTIGRPPWVFWGCVLGLISEPFWLWSALKPEHAPQWGVVILVAVYATTYLLGIIGHWPWRRRSVVPDEHEGEAI
jgi:hypothetical protein